MAIKDRTEIESRILEGTCDELAVEFCGEDVGSGLTVEAPVVLVRDKDPSPENVLELVSEDRSLDVVIEIY